MSVSARSRVTSQAQPTLPTSLPEYEALQYALSPESQRKLSKILDGYDFKYLTEHLNEAIAAVTNSTTEINERLADRKTSTETRVRKLRERAAQQSTREEPRTVEQLEESIKKFGQDVEGLTERADRQMRRIIDSQQNVNGVESSVAATLEHATSLAQTQAQTASQQPPPQQPPGGFPDDEYPELEPTAQTAPTSSIPNLRGPNSYFKEYLDDEKLRYENLDLEERYGGNQAYAEFRGLIHDALHGEDGPPRPPPSEWFKEGVPARPGETQQNEDDDDEDIQVTRAVTSTKCPITLQEFREPLTSTKCPHTFEASAIKEMISQSRSHMTRDTSGLTGGPVIQCPVASCDVMLCLEDLHKDVLVERRIRRLQRAKQMQQDEAMADIDEDGGSGERRDEPAYIDDTGHDDIDEIDEEPSIRAKLKRERMSVAR